MGSSSLTRMEPKPPALRAWSLSHWITRESLIFFTVLDIYIFFNLKLKHWSMHAGPPLSSPTQYLYEVGGVGESLERRWWATDYREFRVLWKPIPEGIEAQDTFLKLKWLLGYTCWMALAPLFAWPGDIQPLAILGQTCPLSSCGEPRFCLVTGHLRFPLVGTNFS